MDGYRIDIGMEHSIVKLIFKGELNKIVFLQTLEKLGDPVYISKDQEVCVDFSTLLFKIPDLQSLGVREFIEIGEKTELPINSLPVEWFLEKTKQGLYNNYSDLNFDWTSGRIKRTLENGRTIISETIQGLSGKLERWSGKLADSRMKHFLQVMERRKLLGSIDSKFGTKVEKWEQALKSL